MEQITETALESSSRVQKHGDILDKLECHDIRLDRIYEQTSKILSISANTQGPLEMASWPAESPTPGDLLVKERDDWEALTSITQNGQQVALGLVGIVRNTM